LSRWVTALVLSGVGLASAGMLGFLVRETRHQPPAPPVRSG
jgi:hypothetical protein